MRKCGGWGSRWQQAWNGGTGEPFRHRSGRSAQAWASAAQEAPRGNGMGCLRSEGHRGQHSLRSCGPGAYEKIVASPKVIIDTSVTYTGLDTKSMSPFVTTPLRFFWFSLWVLSLADFTYPAPTSSAAFLSEYLCQHWPP